MQKSSTAKNSPTSSISIISPLVIDWPGRRAAGGNGGNAPSDCSAETAAVEHLSRENLQFLFSMLITTLLSGYALIILDLAREASDGKC